MRQTGGAGLAGQGIWRLYSEYFRQIPAELRVGPSVRLCLSSNLACGERAQDRLWISLTEVNRGISNMQPSSSSTKPGPFRCLLLL